MEAHDDFVALYRRYVEECLRLGVRPLSTEEMEGLLLMIAPAWVSTPHPIKIARTEPGRYRSRY